MPLLPVMRAWSILYIILMMVTLACSSFSARISTERVVHRLTRTPLPTLTPTVEGQNPLPTLPPPTPGSVSASPSDLPAQPAATLSPVSVSASPSDLPAPAAQPAANLPPGTQNGVVAKLAFRDNKNTYAAGEKVFVNIEATNVEGGIKPVGVLGLILDSGDFQTIGESSQIEAGRPFTHEGDVAVSTPGLHKLWVTMCFLSKDECQGANGNWVRFDPGLTLIVQ